MFRAVSRHDWRELFSWSRAVEGNQLLEGELVKVDFF